MKKFANLYLDELRPNTEVWTLNRVVIIVASTAAIMLVANMLLSWQIAKVQEQNQRLVTQGQRLQEQLTAQQELLEQRINNPELLADITELEEKIAERQRLEQQISNVNVSQASSFSELMNDMARVDTTDIWLQRITFTNGQLTFEGLTQKPQALPQWLANFSQYKSLQGHQFSMFELREEAEGPLSFTVGSEDSADGAEREQP